MQITGLFFELCHRQDVDIELMGKLAHPFVIIGNLLAIGLIFCCQFLVGIALFFAFGFKFNHGLKAFALLLFEVLCCLGKCINFFLCLIGFGRNDVPDFVFGEMFLCHIGYQLEDCSYWRACSNSWRMELRTSSVRNYINV